jgi:hypothetical protein
MKWGQVFPFNNFPGFFTSWVWVAFLPQAEFFVASGILKKSFARQMVRSSHIPRCPSGNSKNFRGNRKTETRNHKRKHPMKPYFAPTSARHITKRFSMGLALTLVATLAHPAATAAVLAVNLGTASGFAVLAGSGITNTGTTTIQGDVGAYPTPAITGFGPVVLDGVNHAGDGVTQGAKDALTAAYLDAAGRSTVNNSGDGYSLTGTLTSGVYNGSGSIAIPGNLTLNGDPNAVWIFQAGSTLTTAPGSKIILTGGAQASNVFWQIGTSATLGTNSDFSGSILALSSITLNTGATVNGRVLARNGAVTMDGNTIAVPEPGSTLLLGAGMAGLLAFRRRGISRI